MDDKFCTSSSNVDRSGSRSKSQNKSRLSSSGKQDELEEISDELDDSSDPAAEGKPWILQIQELTQEHIWHIVIPLSTSRFPLAFLLFLP